MAKKNEQSKGSGESRGFLFAGILLFVFGAIIMFMSTYTSSRSKIYNSTSSESLQLLAEMSDELRKVNENVLEVVGGIGDPATNVAEITLSFDAIEASEAEFEALPLHSDAETRRYNQAKTFMRFYRERLNAMQVTMNQGGYDAATMRALYTQEIEPLSFTASEMLEAAIALNNVNTLTLVGNIARLGAVTGAITVGLIVLGEVAVYVASRIAKRRREEIEKRTKQAEAAANKFKHSQQKVSELALMNILTNMKNRYALDNDLSERLDSDNFNIAVFDMDNFKIINDTYGYDFGDEYLAQIAERIKTEYSQNAEIYNIIGNTFAFVFNKDVSDVQATRLAQNILMSMSDVYNVANLAIQLTCSGCIYHYIAGDCQNLSGVLVKMDGVIRNTKMQGGNAVYTVDNI